MKRLLQISFLLLFVQIASGQEKLDDFGRIILNTYLPDDMSIPSEAKNFLSTKLSQIASNNGMGGSQLNPRFVITAAVNVGTKDIIPGPPQMIAQNLEVTLFVGDALDNTIYSNVILNVKGVGTNENKAFIEAIKTINPKNKEILDFLETGKKKIIDYYTSQCDFILKNALSLAKLEKYDEAIYALAVVPEVCQECYNKCLDTATYIYQQKINAECKVKLNEAKMAWSGSLNAEGAERAGSILSSINPLSNCQSDVDNLIKSIDSKLKADEKKKWDFQMKQYADKVAAQKEQMRIAEENMKRDDAQHERESSREAAYREKQSLRNHELDKLRVNANREVALEYARNQPKTINHYNINWR
jgi:hypothetical protein